MEEKSTKIFIMLFLYFSLFSLFTCSTLINPIPLKAHDRVFFSLTPESNYIIYSYLNDMPDSSYDLIIRLFNTPRYQTMIYVYYSVIDVSKNLDSLIKYEKTYDKFSGYFYSCNIADLSKNLYEVVLNKNTDNIDSNYLKPGYIYTIIHLISKQTRAEHHDWFYIYNSYHKPTLFQKVIEYYGTETVLDYFLVGSHHLRNITYYIPFLSKDELLKYSYTIKYGSSQSISDTININIYQASMIFSPYLKDTYVFNTGKNIENVKELERGSSYFIQITHSTNLYFREEIMFQKIEAIVPRVYEGHPISVTTFGNRFLHFYLNISEIDEKYYFFKVYNIHDDDLNLVPKFLYSNDYNYIISQKDSMPSTSCEKKKDNIEGKITYFYKCNKSGYSKILLLGIKTNGGAGYYPDIYAEYIPRHQIRNPDDIKNILRNGQIGYYLITDLKELTQYNYNMLLYTNAKNGMTVNIFNLEPTSSYKDKKMYNNITLFFLDPTKPENENIDDDKPANTYTIFLFHPYEKEYSFEIKFISKNLQFTQEFNIPLADNVKKMIYNGDTKNDVDVYHIMIYEGETDDYTVTYQAIYGNYEAEMILLDDINCSYINDFMNNDNFFNKKYALDLDKPSKLGKNVFIHINIKKPNISYLNKHHISFYKNILKYKNNINYQLKQGQQIRFLLKPGDSKNISFEFSESEFNYEIRFLGNINSNKYNITIIDCNTQNNLILDSKNKVIREKCSNIYKDIELTIKCLSSEITGLIIKRALPLNLIDNIVNDTSSSINIYNKITLINYVQNIEGGFIINTNLNITQKNNEIAIYEEY